MTPCTRCDGTGIVYDDGDAITGIPSGCPTCDGTGCSCALPGHAGWATYYVDDAEQLVVYCGRCAAQLDRWAA